MKIISLFMMAFLLVGTFGFVAAEEVEDETVPEAKKVGFFQNQMFKIKTALTFDKEKKIDMTLEMAERRLAEAELLAEENPEAYEAAQARYDELVARAEEILANMGDGNGDVNKSLDYMERMARIQNKFEKHRDHADEIYARAIDRLETNNATDEKIERFEMFYERALERNNEMEQKMLEKRENAVRKHKALSEMTDEELNELLVKIEEKEGLKESREQRMENVKERAKKFNALIGLDEVEVIGKLDEANLSDDQKADILEKLEKLDASDMPRLPGEGMPGPEGHGGKPPVSAEELRNTIEAELAGRGSDKSDNGSA